MEKMNDMEKVNKICPRCCVLILLLRSDSLFYLIVLKGIIGEEILTATFTGIRKRLHFAWSFSFFIHLCNPLINISCYLVPGSLGHQQGLKALSRMHHHNDNVMYLCIYNLVLIYY